MGSAVICTGAHYVDVGSNMRGRLAAPSRQALLVERLELSPATRLPDPGSAPADRQRHNSFLIHRFGTSSSK